MTPIEKKRILMVDDDEDLVYETASTLNDAGYLVDSAFDGIKGKKLADTGAYDLVLLDVKMPGMRGPQILKDLKEKKLLSKIIVITGSLIKDSSLEECSIIDLADGFIEKPFNPVELLTKIKNILS